ncbi:MAG TPA: hypothetical protein VN549_06990 [Negativicutes bacterium]|nr:hypothetical protein [Negativicutes bacterium]
MNKSGMVNIDKVAERAAAAAIKMLRDEEKAKRKKVVLRNTELLLRNYNLFKKYLNIARHGLKLNTEELDIDDRDERVFVLAILRSKARTVIMLTNIDVAMEELKAEMVKKEQRYKFDVVKALYLDSKTYEVVAEELNCSEASVRRWKNEMVDELGIMLFGVDGLKLEV